MKKIVFLCSHFYSGSSILYDAMDKNPQIQGFKKNNISYSNPTDLITFGNLSHKTKNRSAIYMDELLKNYSFHLKNNYDKCKFIYLVREPEATLNFWVTDLKKSPIFAAREYCFRLRRICELASKTPGAVFLNWDDLKRNNSFSLIQDYLNLKENIYIDPSSLKSLEKPIDYSLIKNDLLDLTKKSYEKYLFFIKNQKLVFINK